MAYVELDDLKGEIPESYLIQGLDDDQDGVVDAAVWETVQSKAQEAVDAPLSLRYATPFTAPLPPIVKRAAMVFAGEMIYRRRGVTEDGGNPFAKEAAQLRAKLEKIGAGELPLSPDIQREKPSGSIVSEPARTHSAAGRLSM